MDGRRINSHSQGDNNHIKIIIIIVIMQQSSFLLLYIDIFSPNPKRRGEVRKGRVL